MLLYESKHFGMERDISFFHFAEFSYTPHLHRSYELIYVKKGKMTLMISGHEYTMEEQEFAFVLPYEIHSIHVYEDSFCYFTVFSPEHIPYLSKISLGKYFENPIFRLIEPMSEDMENSLFVDAPDIFFFEACLYQCCSVIMKHTILVEKDTKAYHLLHTILSYCQEHFMEEELSLTKIASKFGYNKQYIARYFKEALGGITFSEFINEIRINHAIYLLTQTKQTITEIGFMCGFSTIRSFNRNFNIIMKESPTEYRNRAVPK